MATENRHHKIAVNVTMHIANPGQHITHAASAVKRKRRPNPIKTAAQNVAKGLGIVRQATQPYPS